MIGLLIVAHGRLAEELVNSASLIMGRIPLLRAVGLTTDQNLDDFATEIQEHCRALENEGATGILIMVDMFGGSCSNVTARLFGDGETTEVALVAGVNLPMVLEAAIDRDLYTLPKLADKVILAGKKSIMDVLATLVTRRR